MFLTPFRFCLLLGLLEVSYTVLSVISAAPNWDSFLNGDCPYYAATAISLVDDGDWDIRNQLPGELKGHEGFFALSKNGRIVPKHSTLLPIMSIPLYLCFGTPGFLATNLIVVFTLMIGVARLAGSGPGARLLALGAYVSTPFHAYTYSFSIDILGTALLVWSFVCAQQKRPVLCGLLAGLAVWAKVYLAILLLPLVLIIIPQGWRATLRCAAAAFVGVLPMLVINAYLFGSPVMTGYDRDARIAPGGYTLTEHYSRFNQPVLAGLGNLLFDRRIGMLYTAPLWFLWPLGLCIAWRVGSRPDRLCLAALVLSLSLNLLVFALYDEWDASVSGNRFLFPALAIGVALQGPAWERVFSSWGGRQRRKSADSRPVVASAS